MKTKHFIIIIIVLGFTIYFPSLFGDFVWDDEEQILNNTFVHSIDQIPELFTGSTFNPGGAQELSGTYYKPMMSACFAILYSLFGPNAFFFHIFQVVIHISNAVLVFLLFLLLLSQKQSKTKVNFFKWIAAGFSILFLVHPINVEAVVYVSALQDVLFLFFGMLALLVAIKQISISKSNLKIDSMILVSALLFLSLLSKETGLIFLVIIFLYLYLFDRERIKKFFISVVGISTCYLILRILIANVYFSKGDVFPMMRASLSERLINIPQIVLYYFKTFLFPKDLFIAQHWMLKSVSWNSFFLPLFIVIGIAILFVAFLKILDKKSQNAFKIYAFFLSWFAFGLGIHLQIVPLDMTVAERWFYLPMIGILGMICVLVFEFVNFSKINTRISICLVLGLTILLIFTFRSISRILDWSNGFMLYSHDSELNPNAFDLQNNLGVELYRNGMIDEAKIHFERSIELAPHWWTNWNNLGAVYRQKEDFELAETYFKKSIENGDYYLAYENYVEALISQEKYTEAKTFLEQDALLKFPFNKRLNEAYFYILNL